MWEKDWGKSVDHVDLMSTPLFSFIAFSPFLLQSTTIYELFWKLFTVTWYNWSKQPSLYISSVSRICYFSMFFRLRKSWYVLRWGIYFALEFNKLIILEDFSQKHGAIGLNNPPFTFQVFLEFVKKLIRFASSYPSFT